MMLLQHEHLIAKRAIGLLRRIHPGVQVAIASFDFDTKLGIRLRLGRKLHGVRIRSGARRQVTMRDARRYARALRAARTVFLTRRRTGWAAKSRFLTRFRNRAVTG